MSVIYLRTHRTEATKYADALAAQRGANRARDTFPGAKISKLERGSRYYLLVRHDDYIGYLKEGEDQ